MLLFKPAFIPSEFIVVGAGGIGSRLIPPMVQLLSSTVKQWLPSVHVTVYDDDIVEEKNLIRQNFTRADIGTHKSLVLARRYSKAYDLQITPSLTKFGPEAVDIPDTDLVVLSCVDTQEARLGILKALRSRNSTRRIILIDGGNEDTFGQVNITMPEWFSLNLSDNQLSLLRSGKFLDVGRFVAPRLLFDFSHYLSPGAPRRELSCADLDQTMAINSMVATGMLGMVQALIFQQPLSYKTLRYDLSYGNSTEPLTYLDIVAPPAAPFSVSRYDMRDMGVYPNSYSFANFSEYIDEFIKPLANTEPVNA